MRIAQLQAATLVIPLDTPTSMSSRTVNERHYTFVRVRTQDGVEGIGFCNIGNKAGHLGTLAVRDLLREVVIGQDLHQVEQIWDSMFRDSLLHGRTGVVMRAMSAIDIALWDAKSRSAGLPLYQYLGGYRENTVPAYASGGYYLEGKTPSDLGMELQKYVEMGFPAVKMKVGRVPLEEDTKRIEAARKAIGPHVSLFLDANNAWNDAPTAIRAVRTWEQFNPGWIEEPVLPDDIETSATIAAGINIPVATGEIESGRWRFKELLDRNGASIIQTDATVCGGITEFRRIANISAGYGVPVAPHWFAELHVHLVASTPNAIWVEYFTDTTILNIKRVFSTELEIKKGELVLPQRPGLGIELNNKAVEKYSVDGWS